VIGLVIVAVVLAAAAVSRRAQLLADIRSISLTDWSRVPADDGGVLPNLAWLHVPESLEQIADRVGDDWLPLPRPRSGMIYAFRSTGRALYLSREGDGTRVEIQITGSCGAFDVAPPPAGDDRWLQFGISPSSGWLTSRIPNIPLEPCPTTGFWVGNGTGQASFIVLEPINARLARPPSGLTPPQSITINVGPGGASALRHDDSGVRAISWQSQGGALEYSGQTLSDRDLQITACRGLLPALLCG
jgi:hypothetical protein